MQSKSGHKGHKRDTCAYHDLDLSIQGVTIKSMVQESMQSMQMVRKLNKTSLGKHLKQLLTNFDNFLFYIYINLTQLKIIIDCTPK